MELDVARGKRVDDAAGPIAFDAFARAIAGRTDRVRLHCGYPESNDYPTATVWPHEPPDPAWAVYLKHPACRWASPVLDLATATGLLDRAGISYWVADSGPTGGIHVTATCVEGLPPDLVRSLREGLKSLLPSFDPNPMSSSPTAAIRPPGSLHRRGGTSQ